MTDQENDSAQVTVGILVYPQCQLAMVHGISDLLSTAAALAAEGATRLRIDLWNAENVEAPPIGADAPPPRILLVPGRLGGPLPAGRMSHAAAWLAENHAAGAIVASSCGGAFLLAEAGLLAGRPATTHWSLAESLQRACPTSRVDPDRILIDDGSIITAGGLLAWTDLGLHLVGQFFGNDILQEVARFFLIDPAGREQSHYRPFDRPGSSADEAVRRAQDALLKGCAWMAVRDLAAIAGLEERTFQRRFRTATGMSPREYTRRLRFDRAREMLRSNGQTIGQVACAVGYADAATFTREFSREMGLAPGEYRRRFQLPPRPRAGNSSKGGSPAATAADAA